MIFPLFRSHGTMRLTIVFGRVNAFPPKPNGKKRHVGTIIGFIHGAMSHPPQTEPTLMESGTEKRLFKRSTVYQKDNLPQGVYQLSGNVGNGHKIGTTQSIMPSAPETKTPKGPETGILKVIRGGSWRSFDSDLRVTSRGKGGFALKTHGIGFRCARDIGAQTGHSTKTGN